jgi:hypothetical protein
MVIFLMGDVMMMLLREFAASGRGLSVRGVLPVRGALSSVSVLLRGGVFLAASGVMML